MPPFLHTSFASQSSRSYLAGRVRSFAYAFAGLHHLVRREPNARIHFLLTIGAIAAGLWLRIGLADWRWLALAIGLVWAAEALNTVIERLCDLVSPGPDDEVKIIKDVAAGAVLVCAATAAALGTATLLPYLETGP